MAEGLPEVFGEVRRVGGEEENEGFHGRLGARLGAGEFVGEFHQPADGGVETEGFDVVGDRFDRLVEKAFLGLGHRDVFDGGVDFDFVGEVFVGDHPPGAGEEAVDPFDAVHLPGFGGIERAHEHFVEAERIGAVLLDDVIGIDDVAAGLGHLLVVLAEDHPLVDEFLKRLGAGEVAEVEEDFVPEAGVEEVKDGVFGAANVEVDREPVFFEFGVDEVVGVFVVGEANVVPARPGPLGHGVGFADEFDAVGVGFIKPFLRGPGEGRIGRPFGFEVVHVRRDDGELVERNGADEAGGVAVVVEFVPERERLAPVALTREEPVAETVVDGFLAEAGLREPGGDFRFDVGSGEAGEFAGVDGEPFGGEADGVLLAALASRYPFRFRCDDCDNRKFKRLGEF